MAGRAKKEAATALTALRDYLSRDRGGLQLLAQVERYNGEIRQEKSQLKDEREQARAATQSALNKVERLAAELTQLRQQRDSALARQHQLQADAAADRKRLEEIEQQLDIGPDVAAESKWWQMFRELRRHMPRAPRTQGMVGSDDDAVRMFSTGDFIHHGTADELLNLGRFVLVTQCGMFQRIGFFMTDKHRQLIFGDSVDKREERMPKFCHWARNWIHLPTTPNLNAAGRLRGSDASADMQRLNAANSRPSKY